MVSAIEKPEYTTVDTMSDDIEIRKYMASKWACTTTNGATSMFMQLFNYISGITFIDNIVQIAAKK